MEEDQPTKKKAKIEPESIEGNRILISCPSTNMNSFTGNEDDSNVASVTAARRKVGSGLSELQELLAALGEEPLPLSFVSRYNISSTTGIRSRAPSEGLAKEDTTTNETVAAKNDEQVEAAMNHADTVLSHLFEQHVGPFDNVLKGMICHYDFALKDEIEYDNSNGRLDHYGKTQRYRCPFNRDLRGPKPNLFVYTELLFGLDAMESVPVEDEKYQRLDAANNREVCLDSFNVINQNLMPFRENKMTFYYKVSILLNSLRYLRDQASYEEDEDDDDDDDVIASKMERFMTFCAIYGLSGAMSDILKGKYSINNDNGTNINNNKKVNIDTPLPMVDHFEPQGNSSFCGIFGDKIYYFPAYVLGCVLGHKHLVKRALNELGGNVHAKYYIKNSSGDGQIQTSELLSGSEKFSLLWAIHNNDTDMVRCLTKDCGIQFRWLSNDDYGYYLWRLLLTYDEYNNGNFVNDKFDPDSFMYESKSVRRWKRKRASFQPKETMVKVLIDCGLPRQLFLPVDLDYSFHKELLERYKDSPNQEPSKEDQEKYKKHFKSLTKVQRKYHDLVYEACANFNDVQPRKGTDDDDDECYDDDPSEDDEDNDNNEKDGDTNDDDASCSKKKAKQKEEDTTLEVPYFYDRLVNLWKDQTYVQDIKLLEYDEYDPRWVEERKKQEKVAEGEEDSHDEDEDYDHSMSESEEYGSESDY